MTWLYSSAVELGFSLIFLWIIYRFVTRKKSKSNKGKLGLPPGPLLGNLHLLGSLRHKSEEPDMVDVTLDMEESEIL
ncbi:hypothetical protein SUGI_0447070 [Cryptomeria japonica]|nr:hypothetical protein SUGI_0447070 [Cryptomeria japonica]